MDVKSVFRSMIPGGLRIGGPARPETKAGSAAERDANGRQEQGAQAERQPLTAEEVREVIKYLENLQGVKENNLIVRFKEADGIRVIYIEDRDGKVVRRIPESEFQFVLANKEKKSGHLLNKAM